MKFLLDLDGVPSTCRGGGRVPEGGQALCCLEGCQEPRLEGKHRCRKHHDELQLTVTNVALKGSSRQEERFACKKGNKGKKGKKRAAPDDDTVQSVHALPEEIEEIIRAQAQHIRHLEAQLNDVARSHRELRETSQRMGDHYDEVRPPTFLDVCHSMPLHPSDT